MESTPHNQALPPFIIHLAFGAGMLAGIANVAYTMPLYIFGWITWAAATQLLGRGQFITHLRNRPKVKLVALTAFLSGFTTLNLCQADSFLQYVISIGALVLSAVILVGVLLLDHTERVPS